MKHKGAMLGIISGIFIGFALVIMSHVTKTVHPFVYSALSAAFSVPFLLLISLFFSGDGLRKTFTEKRRDFMLTLFERFILASGILLTFGLSMTVAIRGVFLVQLEPALVLAWSVFLLKERIRKRKVFLVATLILGAFLVITGGGIGAFGSLLIGDALIILAVVLLSHSYIMSSRLMETANPFRLYFGFSVISVPVFLLLSLLLLPLSSFMVGLGDLLLILAGALFFNLIGFPLWLISLKHMRPWVLSSAIMVQTLAGAFLSFLWLGQTLSLVQMIGGIVILISVYFISTKG